MAVAEPVQPSAVELDTIQEMDTGQAQQAPTSWIQSYPELNPDDPSYQSTGDGYFWHRAEPGTLVEPGTFVTYYVDGAQGHYKNAHLLTEAQNPAYGTEFWLLPVGASEDDPPTYSVGNYAYDDSADGSIYVPWGHIVEHLYGYCALQDKESHSFFPPGTTEVQLLQYLVDALNSGQDVVGVDGADAQIRWTDESCIKTFFRNLPDGHIDKYTIEEMTFVKDCLG
jgi:hypothetical protein